MEKETIIELKKKLERASFFVSRETKSVINKCVTKSLHYVSRETLYRKGKDILKGVLFGKISIKILPKK